jgi:hypothetical protein
MQHTLPTKKIAEQNEDNAKINIILINNIGSADGVVLGGNVK